MTRLYSLRLPGLVRGNDAERHRPPHEAEIGGRFAGPNKQVHLIGLGEVVERLGRGFADRLHRPAQTAEGFTDRNQLAAFTLHGSFSHVPQTARSESRGRGLD